MPHPRSHLNDRKPLQTHGQYFEVWHPPRSRFVTYDHRDEFWMRPLGLGCVERRLEPLFDVLDEESKLIGYTRHNPCDNRPHLDLTIVQGDLIFDRKARVHGLRIEVVTYGFREEFFDTWVVPIKAAPLLVSCRWIELLGTTGLNDFIRDLRIRADEREHQRWLRLRASRQFNLRGRLDSVL